MALHCQESETRVAVLAAPACGYLCHCLKITEDQVTQAIVDQSATKVCDVIDCTGAGAGCTACHRRIRQLIDEHSLACV